ncbi:MAG: nucleoside-diphosphate kinase [Puniceicoccales bacterium]|jgi:nucleoside-diphosphate kinase|nr:nucleoside-diphosphate kinase [Puniceicoccales bacterium]
MELLRPCRTSIAALLFAALPLAGEAASLSTMQKTVIIFKPDAVEAGRVGAILSRFEGAQLRIAAMKMVQLDEQILREHYAHLVSRPFFGEIADFMRETPVVVAVLEGENAVDRVREMAGPTDSAAAPKGSIRGDFGTNKMRNMLHASDTEESARVEVDRFFSPGEVF